MPEIGNPNEVRNAFRNIKMAPKSTNALNNSKNKKDLGDSLNRLAGVDAESKFVKRGEHNKMNKDSFLKLLSNQLSNQDPLKPVDQKRFAADLAQFSQLEQLANLNSKFDKSTSNAPHQAKFMGASFLGKEVLTKGTSINYDGQSRNVNLPFSLKKPAQKLMIRIFDKSNNMIQQMDLNSRGLGSQSVTWDGFQMDNTPALSGEYRFEVRAYDEQYNEFMGDTRAKGKVTGVSFEGEEMILTVDGSKKVFLRDVDSFSLAKNSLGRAAEKNAGLNKAATKTYNKMNNPTH